MIAYRTPGVYFERTDNRPTGPGLVRVDIAGFVGIAERGPLHRPVKIESWTQFVSLFGGFVARGYLAYSVRGFFANGGATCWVVRTSDPVRARASTFTLCGGGARGVGVGVAPLVPAVRLSAAVRIDNPPDAPTADNQAAGLDLPVANPGDDVEDAPGSWGDGVRVTLRRTGAGRSQLTLVGPDGSQEVYRDLSLDLADPNYLVGVLNGDPRPRLTGRGGGQVVRDPRPGGSRLVRALDLRTDAQRPPGAPAIELHEVDSYLSGGFDGLAPSLELRDVDDTPRLRLAAAPPGSSGRTVMVRVDSVAPDGTPLPSDTFTLLVSDGVAVSDSFTGLTLDPRSPNYAVRRINDRAKGSRLVKASDLAGPPPSDPRTGKMLEGWPGTRLPPGSSSAWIPVAMQPGIFALGGGLGPVHLSGLGAPVDTRWGLATFELVDEVSAVGIPDLSPPQTGGIGVKRRPPDCRSLVPAPLSGPEPLSEFAPAFSPTQVAALIAALTGHCDRLKDRMALVDPPFPGPASSRQVLEWLDDQGIDSSYAAAYYPWLKVDDPLQPGGLPRSVPPCGHVAGIYARTDGELGPHKPPANAEIFGAEDLNDVIDDASHADLNDRGVDVIRAYPGRGVRVAGARTLSSDPGWRYVNVRRLLLMIEASIVRQTQWVVFEPNNPELRTDLTRVIGNLLGDLWLRGMLGGATAADSYTVRCDDSTNPPEEAAAGRLVCEVGVRPPAPAEFVVVRIGKTEYGTVVLDRNGR